MNWISGKTPDTPEGTETPFWVTLRRVKTGKLVVRPMWWCNKYRMPLNENHWDNPPDYAEPIPDSEDYLFTRWSNGDCEQCETTWMFQEGEFEILAYAPAPKPFVEKPEEPAEEIAARIAKRESTVSPALLARGVELGLTHIWYGRFRGRVGEVVLSVAGSDAAKDGLHVAAFTEFGGHGALQQVMATLARARELGYEAWCCDNNPGYGGYIAPRKLVKT